MPPAAPPAYSLEFGGTSDRRPRPRRIKNKAGKRGERGESVSALGIAKERRSQKEQELYPPQLTDPCSKTTFIRGMAKKECQFC